MAEQAGDVLRANWCVMTQMLALAYGGKLAEAEAQAQELVDRGWPGVTGAWCRSTLAEVLMTRDPERATELMEQVIDDARRLSDRFLTGVALLSAASLRAHGTGTRPARFHSSARCLNIGSEWAIGRNAG